MLDWKKNKIVVSEFTHIESPCKAFDNVSLYYKSLESAKIIIGDGEPGGVEVGKHVLLKPCWHILKSVIF